MSPAAVRGEGSPATADPESQAGAKRFSGQPSERRRRSGDANKLAESFKVGTPPECDQVVRTVKLAMGTDVAASADFQSKISGGEFMQSGAFAR